MFIDAAQHRCLPIASVVLAALAVTLPAAGQTSLSLDFTDPTPTDPTGDDPVSDTGFDAAYNPNLGAFDVTDGRLNIQTLAGDIFGRFENDPDDAQNVFYSDFEALDQTVVETSMTISDLNVNFHGGGIWLGTDTDHYIRLGVIHNGGNAVVEVLRENEDLRPGPDDEPPFVDIIGRQSGPLGSAGVGSSFDIMLRLVLLGDTATAFYSTDGGTSYSEVGGDAVFDVIPTDASGGATVEGGFKVGVFAFGGPPDQTSATASFDSFSAVSTVIPEPTTLGLAGIAGLALLRRRR